MKTYPAEVEIAQHTSWPVTGSRLVLGKVRGVPWWSNGFVAAEGLPPEDSDKWKPYSDGDYKFEERLFKDGTYETLFPIGLFPSWLPQPTLILATEDGSLVIPVQVCFYHHFYDGWRRGVDFTTIIANKDHVVEAWAAGHTVGLIMPIRVPNWLDLSTKFGVKYRA